MRPLLTAVLLFCASLCHAQFGGVMQPMFSATSGSSGPSTANLVLWLKAEDLTAANNTIQQNWPDRSGSFNDQTTSVGKVWTNALGNFSSMEPCTLQLGTNGIAAVNKPFCNGAAGLSWYAVLKGKAGANNGGFIALRNPTDSDVRWYLQWVAGGIRSLNYAPDGSNFATSDTFSLPADFTSRYYLLEAIVNFTGSSVTFYTNGVVRGADSTYGAGQSLSATNPKLFWIGTSGSTAVDYYLVETLLYAEAHPTQTRTNVENYIRAKFTGLW